MSETRQPIVKRAKDFKESGNYDVRIGDKTYQIYRDTFQFGFAVWHRTDVEGPQSMIGFTRQEAIENLLKTIEEE